MIVLDGRRSTRGRVGRLESGFRKERGGCGEAVALVALGRFGKPATDSDAVVSVGAFGPRP